jgi:protochlorophyllide reductase
MRELHRRYHDSTGITFSSLLWMCCRYAIIPAIIYPLFQKLFPLFSKKKKKKLITWGYVSPKGVAGERVAMVVCRSTRYKSQGIGLGNRQER